MKTKLLSVLFLLSFTLSFALSSENKTNEINQTTGVDEIPLVPENLFQTSRSENSIVLVFANYNNPTTVNEFEIYQDDVLIATARFRRSTLTYQTNLLYTVTNLSPGTSYEFKVRAKDISGNFSDFSETLTASTSAADVEDPTIPSHLRSNNVTRTSINISWLRSTDNVRVGLYEIYLNGEKVADSYYNVYQARNLEPGTSYEFKVRAKDLSGNFSDFSETLTVSTLPSTPQQPGSSNTALNIYPNPVVDILNVELDSNNNNIKYSIYNSSQRVVVYSRTLIDNKINVSSLRTGVYYLVVQDNANRYIKTFYKN